MTEERMPRKIIWYTFSFRRFFGDVERHRIPILCTRRGDRFLYVWKCRQCHKVFKSVSLGYLKKQIFTDIRTHSGD